MNNYSKYYRFLKTVLSFSKPQLNFQKIKVSNTTFHYGKFTSHAIIWVYSVFHFSSTLLGWTTTTEPLQPEAPVLVLMLW